MAWWAWVAIWGALVAAAGIFFLVMGLSLRRQVHDVTHEIEVASERFALITEQLERIQAASDAAATAAPQPAPFDDVSRLRREHSKAVRQAKAITVMRIKARTD